MYTLSVTIKQKRGPELIQSKLNEMVRQALKAAALFWIKEFMPLHFQEGAYQRYSYAARGARYNAIKRKAETVRDWHSGNKMPRPKPAAPLVWTGSFREQLLNRTPQAFNMSIAATKTKQTVRVKLPCPHPLNPKNASEPGRLITEEIRQMQKVAIQEFNYLLDALQSTTTKRLKAA